MITTECVYLYVEKNDSVFVSSHYVMNETVHRIFSDQTEVWKKSSSFHHMILMTVV